MNMRDFKGRRKRVLAKRLAVTNIAINILVAAIITGWLLYGSYQAETSATQHRISEISKAIVPGLIKSLWQVNPYATNNRLDEISNIPGVEYIRLHSEGSVHERGRLDANPQATHTYSLTYVDHGRFDLGTLTVEFGWAPVRQKLMRQAIQIGIATLAPTLSGTLAILLLTQLWMTNPLEAMSSYLRTRRVETLNVPLALRKAKPNRPRDEIDEVATAINRMRRYLAKNIATRIRHEKDLEAHREQLEMLVKKRTTALEEKTLELQLQSQTFEKMANTDALTGAYSRRFFIEMAMREIARRARNSTSLALMLMDIDYFKKINDTHGHSVGDQVLVGLVSTCRSQLREIDLLGRLGGEEFGLLLPEIDADGALTVAERLRSALEALKIPVPDESGVRFTVSIGICMLSDSHDNYEALMAHADKALYDAKGSGRNCVRVFDARQEAV